MRAWWILVTAASVERQSEAHLRDEYVAEAQRNHERMKREGKEGRVEELRRTVKEVYVRKTPEYKALMRGAGVWEQQLGYQGPVLATRPHNEEEVRNVLRWADKHKLTVSVKSAGTQPGAWALQSDVLLHMGAINQVKVGDGREPYLTVGGGARWADVYAAADAQDLNANGAGFGDSVVGTVLSGGASWWGYRHGIVADSVVRARIVLPNGDVVTAGTHFDPESKETGPNEADVLWTLRGGFPTGIVTELTLIAYPQRQFIMGRMQCPAPQGSEEQTRVVLNELITPVTTADATIQLKLTGGYLWLHFVADEIDALRPMLAARVGHESVLRPCDLVDLRGHHIPGDHEAAITSDAFVHSRLSDMPKYMLAEFGSPEAFHGEAQGALLTADAVAGPLSQAFYGANVAPGAVDIEVWPVRSAPQDQIGHAWPHQEPLLAIVRCQVLGVCPQLWLWLAPATRGLYAAQMSDTLPGDIVRIYGPTYRASHCLVQTLSPTGPKLVLGDAPAHRPEDASAVAQKAQMMLACNAPFLAFDSCAPEHQGSVLVTGGSSGLGLVATRMLAQQGLKVLIASRNEVECARAAQEVYLETGYSPFCLSANLEDRGQIDRLVTQVAKLVPEGLDAAIFAAARLPDGMEVQPPKQLDGAVKVVLGNLYLASQLTEKQVLATSGRVVFVTSRMAFRKASPEVLGVLSQTKTYSETYVSAQAIAAFGAQGLRMAYPTLSVGLAVASPVRTKMVEQAVLSGRLDEEVMSELEPAPHGPAALLASGSALLRALEPGFCADGCGELQCSLPDEGVCSMWTEASQFIPLPGLETCPFSFRTSFVAAAVREGMCGSIAAAFNVILTLPMYNVLDVNVQTGQGLLAATAVLRDHERGFMRFYYGLSTALTLGPVVRFGDTFAHAAAARLFGTGSVVGILLVTMLVCIVYPLWRLLIYLIAFPEKVGLQVKSKNASAEPVQSKVGTILYTTVLAAFPFWGAMDATMLLLQPNLGQLAWPLAGAIAGLASCLCAVSGTGLCMRLPLCAFEGALFVVAWKVLCSITQYYDIPMY